MGDNKVVGKILWWVGTVILIVAALWVFNKSMDIVFWVLICLSALIYIITYTLTRKKEVPTQEARPEESTPEQKTN